MSHQLGHQDALVYVMVMMSAVDSAMTDRELERIGRLVRFLPVFEGFDDAHLLHVSQECTALIDGPEGLDIALEVIREAVPPHLADTAYALAVEVAAADHRIRNEEIRLLQMLRDRLGLDKLTCAAIERGAIARFRRP
ncbi:tellurite resistance TerB family protein [Rhizobium sp. TRM95111]|uniref:tellurite resistance TerB family protein n=1 Tax=Rhizobium alarense TaxID=2846851 RepID=UPI001F27D4E6|nr:tellurite resistance TerB family protein [Rhizobium alarense]MCF3642211.1 tellurite resistance TerB family protein [Rhizobium alarense]